MNINTSQKTIIANSLNAPGFFCNINARTAEVILAWTNGDDSVVDATFSSMVCTRYNHK